MSDPSREHAPQHGGGTIIDPGALQGLRELGGEEDPGLLLDLITMFLDDAATRVQALEEAWERGDLEGVSRSAHTLKSSSASIGALPFSSVCKQIEKAARTGHETDLPSYVERCQGMFAEVCSALEELRSNL